jgi:SAM-dependent methyltransferase
MTYSNPAAYERLMGRWSARLAPLFARFAGVREGQRILDVGCGTGSLSRTLLAAGRAISVVGVDPASVTVTTAGSPSGTAATASAMESRKAWAKSKLRRYSRKPSRCNQCQCTPPSRFPSTSSWTCNGLGLSPAAANSLEILPMAVEAAVCVTTILPRPRVTSVFMKAMFWRLASGASSRTAPVSF